uniref:Uncharacterized protein n=1 Tax=Anguilla anguilla TaxID=7936 RepID=A0A0E9WWU6_ANGAN
MEDSYRAHSYLYPSRQLFFGMDIRLIARTKTNAAYIFAVHIASHNFVKHLLEFDILLGFQNFIQPHNLKLL